MRGCTTCSGLWRVSCLLLAVWRRVTRRERWAGESVAVGAIALIGLALDASFLRNPLETRLADATVPACLLGAWLLGLAWTMKGRLAIVIPVRLARERPARGDHGRHLARRRRARQAGRGRCLRRRPRTSAAAHGGRCRRAHAVPKWTRASCRAASPPGSLPFFRYLNRCTATTDRLLVSGPYPDVFVLARRGFAGGHIAFMEGLLSLRRRSAADAGANEARVRSLRGAAARRSGCVRPELSAHPGAPDRCVRRAGRHPGGRIEGRSHPRRTGPAAHGDRR